MKRLVMHGLCWLVLFSILLLSLSSCTSLFGKFTPDDEDPSDDPGVQDTLLQNSPVVINEICADNKGSLTIGNEHYDWIELYNTTDETIDISGWHISDDYDNLKAYTFPADTTIAGHGYLVLMAVGAEEASLWQNVRPAAPFRLSEDGEALYLSDENSRVRETIDYPAIHIKDVEITYARLTDGEDIWGEADPSPVASNNAHGRVISESIMTFSHESGFYKDPFTLRISVPDGYTIYYTTDCSDPRTSATAEKWNGSLHIRDKSSEEDTFSSIKVCDDYMYVPEDPVDKCFVLRAYVSGKSKRSRTITKTFFINYDTKDGYTDIPVLTLTADPYDLYDETEGLFVAEQWGHDSSVNRQEITADMTYLNEDGEYVFSQKVGMRIRGTSTRGKHQKNLNIFARSRYDGNTSFIDPLFEGVTETKSFVLRNDDMDRLNIGQGFLQDMVTDREISTQDYYPVAVFLDGEYYGIYNLYERFSEDYVEAHYGVDSDNVWIAKKGGSASTLEMNCAEAGSDYTALMHFICNFEQNNDLSKFATYKKLTEWVDVQSLADILAVQLYIGNEDFSMSQNITAWRSATVDPSNPYADGKWRFVIYDLDFTLECTANDVTYSYDYNPFTQSQPWAGSGFLYWGYNWKNEYPFTRNLLRSSTFKNLLANTFVTIATVNFEYSRVSAEMVNCLQRLLPNMENYVARYHSWYRDGAETLESDFYNNIQPNRTYLQNRADYFLPYMRSALGLSTALLPHTPYADEDEVSAL